MKMLNVRPPCVREVMGSIPVGTQNFSLSLAHVMFIFHNSYFCLKSFERINTLLGCLNNKYQIKRPTRVIFYGFVNYCLQKSPAG